MMESDPESDDQLAALNDSGPAPTTPPPVDGLPELLAGHGKGKEGSKINKRLLSVLKNQIKVTEEFSGAMKEKLLKKDQRLSEIEADRVKKARRINDLELEMRSMRKHVEALVKKRSEDRHRKRSLKMEAQGLSSSAALFFIMSILGLNFIVLGIYNPSFSNVFNLDAIPGVKESRVFVGAYTSERAQIDQLNGQLDELSQLRQANNDLTAKMSTRNQLAPKLDMCKEEKNQVIFDLQELRRDNKGVLEEQKEACRRDVEAKLLSFQSESNEAIAKSAELLAEEKKKLKTANEELEGLNNDNHQLLKDKNELQKQATSLKEQMAEQAKEFETRQQTVLDQVEEDRKVKQELRETIETQKIFREESERCRKDLSKMTVTSEANNAKSEFFARELQQSQNRTIELTEERNALDSALVAKKASLRAAEEEHKESLRTAEEEHTESLRAAEEELKGLRAKLTEATAERKTRLAENAAERAVAAAQIEKLSLQVTPSEEAASLKAVVEDLLNFDAGAIRSLSNRVRVCQEENERTNNLLEKFNKETMSNNTQLETCLTKVQSQMRELTETHTAHRRENDDMTDMHEREITRLTASHSRDLDDTHERHTREITRLEEASGREITRVEEANTRQITQMTSEHLQEISLLTSKHSQEIDLLSRNHSQEVALLTSEHSQEVALLTSEHSQEVSTFKSVQLSHSEQIANLKSIHRKDLEDAAALAKQHEQELRVVEDTCLQSQEAQTQCEATDTIISLEKQIASLQERAALQTKTQEQLRETLTTEQKACKDDFALMEQAQKQLKHAYEGCQSFGVTVQQQIEESERVCASSVTSCVDKGVASIQKASDACELQIAQLRSSVDLYKNSTQAMIVVEAGARKAFVTQLKDSQIAQSVCDEKLETLKSEQAGESESALQAKVEELQSVRTQLREKTEELASVEKKDLEAKAELKEELDETQKRVEVLGAEKLELNERVAVLEREARAMVEAAESGACDAVELVQLSEEKRRLEAVVLEMERVTDGLFDAVNSTKEKPSEHEQVVGEGNYGNYYTATTLLPRLDALAIRVKEAERVIDTALIENRIISDPHNPHDQHQNTDGNFEENSRNPEQNSENPENSVGNDENRTTSPEDGLLSERKLEELKRDVQQFWRKFNLRRWPPLKRVAALLSLVLCDLVLFQVLLPRDSRVCIFLVVLMWIAVSYECWVTHQWILATLFGANSLLGVAFFFKPSLAMQLAVHNGYITLS